MMRRNQVGYKKIFQVEEYLSNKYIYLLLINDQNSSKNNYDCINILINILNYLITFQINFNIKIGSSKWYMSLFIKFIKINI